LGWSTAQKQVLFPFATNQKGRARGAGGGAGLIAKIKYGLCRSAAPPETIGVIATPISRNLTHVSHGERELVCSGAFVAYGDDFDRLRLIILWTANDAKVPK
jgi:hypothetical protein